ncbi:MAG: hypothetical protein ACI358_07855 [Candidatus Limimorpha sp.]
MEKFSKIAFIAVFLLVLVGCNKKETVAIRELSDNDYEIVDKLLESGDEGIPLPEGSVVSRNANEVYTITLPKGYSYVVRKYGERSITEEQVIGVTCTCTEGSSCSPVTFDGSFYCIVNNGCYVCQKTLITNNNRGMNQEVELLGLINRNVGITLLCEESVPVTNNSILNASDIIRGKEVIHDNAFEELFEIEDVREMCKTIGEAKNKSGLEPNVLAYVNFYGNVAAVPMYIEEGKFVFQEGDKEYFAMTVPGSPDKKPECRCDDNSRGSCELKTAIIPFVGTGYLCKSDVCKTCSLIFNN